MTSYPTISIVIPTFNESDCIDSCLKSIFSQFYPKEKLDVIIVDNHSTDSTLTQATKYPLRIFKDNTRDAQYLKMIGFRRARGEYFIFLDADNRLRGLDWFKKMLMPHKDKRIAGSYTDIIPDPHDSPLSQYFATFSFYSSPLFSFFSTNVTDTIVGKIGEYFVCEYTKDKIPPTGSCLYKMRYLTEAGIGKEDKFMELDVISILVKKGFTRFAYVPGPGMYHTHIQKLSAIWKKRKRNIDRNYLKDIEKRYFTWIDYRNPLDIFKLIVWTVYSLTIVGPTLRGVIKAVGSKEVLFIYYEPAVCFIETVAVIRAILASSHRGLFFRRFIQG